MRKNSFFRLISLLLCFGLLLSFASCSEKEEGDASSTESNASSEADNNKKGDYITICSYNIKCANYSKTWNEVCENIRQADPDIIGLQEIDSYTSRSGQYDQIEKLAKDLGYEYYYFAKTIDYAGGEYGHGILSKFPIKESKVIVFDAQKNETRNVERHVIDVNGKDLVFYNTHLAGLPEQYVEIQNLMVADMEAGKHAVLTGDLNLEPYEIKDVFNSEKLVALNGYLTLNNGEDGEHTLESTRIDNIIVSSNIDTYMDESAMIGLMDIDNEASDHPMIYTYIKLK